MNRVLLMLNQNNQKMNKERTPRKQKKEILKDYVRQFDDFVKKHNQEMKLKKLLLKNHE